MLDFMIQYLRVCDWILKEFLFFRNKVVGTKRSNNPTQEIFNWGRLTFIVIVM